MHTSPLTKLFEVDHRRNPMFALQQIVLDAHDLENEAYNLNTSTGTHPLSRTEELEQLEESAPTQMINIGEVIQEVLETRQPLLASTQATATYTPQKNHRW